VLGVFGLNFQTEERDLRRAFEKYGKLDKVKLVTDPRTNRSRGFAFIYFDKVEDAEDAKDRVHGSTIDGNHVRVEYSISNREHNPTPGVYMGRRNNGKGYDDDEDDDRRKSRSRSRSRSYERSMYLSCFFFFLVSQS
jgi:transformer-2 protein